MSNKHIYEYSIIRVVPKVERGEFCNIGVIVFSKPLQFLDLEYHMDKHRLQTFSSEIDIEDILLHLRAWKDICRGAPHGGPIGHLEMHERFRYLIAPKSTILQCAPVHPGRTDNPRSELTYLLDKYVM